MMHRWMSWIAAVAASGSLQAQVEVFEFNGSGALDQFGEALAGAGDVNGDGVDDIVVGAPQAWLLTGVVGAGHASVYSGADGATLHLFGGDADGDRFGGAVAGGADLDGDGCADVLVGADQGGQFGFFGAAGYTRLFSGKTGAMLRQFSGAALGDNFGHAVAIAGDVDLDGFPDVLIGAPGTAHEGGSAGLARVFSGADGSTLVSVYGEPATDLFLPGDRLGTSVAAAGDLDGDGHADFLAGLASAWIFSAGHGNQAIAFSGSSGARLYTFTGDNDYDGLGSAIASAGDVDADGTPDLLAGAPLDSSGSDLLAGSARVFSGAAGSAIHFLVGDVGSAGFGSSVAGAGDVDGDGHDDVAIASQIDSGTNKGVARVIGGASGQVLAGWQYAGGDFGVAITVAAAGDIDQDGHADLLIGANQRTVAGQVCVLAPHAALGDPVPSSSFTPGDALVGAILHQDDVDEAHFLAVAGASLTFQLADAGGGLSAIDVSLHPVKNGKLLAAIKTWQADVGKPLVAKLKQNGTYALRLRTAGPATGIYSATTSMQLGKQASSHSATLKVKAKQGDAVAYGKFRALAGSRLDASVTLLGGGTPEVEVIAPSGDPVPGSLFAVALDGPTAQLIGVPLLENGKYRLRVLGGGVGDKVEIGFELTPPSAGLSIAID